MMLELRIIYIKFGESEQYLYIIQNFGIVFISNFIWLHNLHQTLILYILFS